MSGSDTDVRVLYVGDDSDGLERTTDTFVVDVAQGIEEAVDRLDDGAYDCVVCEYELPEATGTDLAETVRDDGLGLPIVLNPAEGSEAIASEAISAGVTDYVGDDTGLAAAVQSAVTGSDVMRDRHRLLGAVESAAEGIALLGDDGYYEYVNDAYAEMYGYAPKDLVGEHKDIVYPSDESFDDVVQSIETAGKIQREGTVAVVLPESSGPSPSETTLWPPPLPVHSHWTVAPLSTWTAGGPNPYAPPLACTPTSTVTVSCPVASTVDPSKFPTWSRKPP